MQDFNIEGRDLLTVVSRKDSDGWSEKTEEPWEFNPKARPPAHTWGSLITTVFSVCCLHALERFMGTSTSSMHGQCAPSKAPRCSVRGRARLHCACTNRRRLQACESTTRPGATLAAITLHGCAAW